MKIAMIASEANPLVKSGGLADVSYALTKELNNNGENAIIVLPFYKAIKENKKCDYKFVKYFYIRMSWRNQYVGIFESNINGIKYYFVDNEYYFNRDGLYGFGDDGERYAYFALASIELLKNIKFKPDVIHVHDWHSAIVPCLLKEKYRGDQFFNGTKTVLTIHNPAFKGYLDKYFLNNFYGLTDELYFNGNVRLDGQVSTLKAGIVYSDFITTVSPTHREELLSDDSPFGLNSVLRLRERDFYGVVNGIDYVEFNPLDDKLIKTGFDTANVTEGKAKNKADLLEAFHLPKNDGPVYSIVSRLTWQKGINLVLDSSEYIIEHGGVIIVLGSGESELESRFQDLRNRYPNNVGLFIGYNADLAHKVYAGSDFFLMPSLFEPCGIGQLIALRYGTIPLVRETGGLADTIIHLKDGFSFKDYTAYALQRIVDMSIETYANKRKLNTLRKNAMLKDNSWKTSMNKYLEIYRTVK